MTFEMIPKTQKGKNRVREHGKKWKVFKFQNMVSFDSRFGPWFLMTPVDGSDNGQRWVHSKDDKDFDLVRI